MLMKSAILVAAELALEICEGQIKNLCGDDEDKKVAMMVDLDPIRYAIDNENERLKSHPLYGVETPHQFSYGANRDMWAKPPIVHETQRPYALMPEDKDIRLSLLEQSMMQLAKRLQNKAENGEDVYLGVHLFWRDSETMNPKISEKMDIVLAVRCSEILNAKVDE